MRRLLACPLAALAVFVWGFLFWGLSADAIGLYRKAPDDAGLGKTLSDTLREDGVYFVPGNMEDTAAWRALHQAGPLAMVHFRRAGADPMEMGLFLAGFLHSLIVAVLLAVLLGAVGAAQRWKVLFWAALTAAVFANLGQPIWFYQSWCYHGLVALYQFVAWLVAGAVLIKMVPREV